MKKIDINKIIDNGDATKVDNVTVLDVNNYNLFSILECNREINEKQVNKLKKLIAKNGYLPSSFVLVDEFFNIVDGQHRFEAQKELGLPIKTMVIEGLSIEHMRLLNTANKNWGNEEFIRHYATLGKENYIILRDIIDKNKDVGYTQILNLMFESRITVNNDIRNGDLKISEEMINTFNKRLKNYRLLLSYKNRFIPFKADEISKIIDILDNDFMVKFLVNKLKTNTNLKINLDKSRAEIYDDIVNLIEM